MTIPFNVAGTILSALGEKRDAMRLVILEDVPTADVDAAEKRNRGKLAFSNGAILGKSIIKYKSSAGGAKVTPIPHSSLDQWFVDEELARPTNHGHVFFVHSKVLLIDPLSDDPLVCSGSANFSTNSLVANDENMLLIRGNARVADIYTTELDRIFRHFRARDIINQTAADGSGKNPLLLDPTDDWITRPRGAKRCEPRSAAGGCRLLLTPHRPRRHLLSLLARLGQRDCNGLLAALHPATLAAWTAPGCATLVASHLLLDIRASAPRISPCPSLGRSLGHVLSRDQSAAKNNKGPIITSRRWA